MIFSEQRNDVAAAYTKAWGKIKSPKHNKEVEVTMKSGGKYTFNYTDLKGIFDAINDLLAEHEIGVLQDAGTVFNEKDQPIVFVQTTLLHSSGQYIQSERIQLDASRDIQGFGGQISYLKRYQLSALMGISTESDDDGNGPAGNEATFKDQGNNAGTPKEGTKKSATDKQKNMIRAKLKTVAETLGTEPDVLYGQIQTKFKTSALIDDLNPMGASKIIEQLMKLEKGELL